MRNRMTTSLIDEFDGFYGRDEDQKAIICKLFSDADNGSNLGVISIVGMGGLGKTTLAEHVYNCRAVREQFDIQAWVCVSDQFDVTKVTKEIVEEVTVRTCPCGDLNQLQHKLHDALDGRKFLLVLDDVWSEDYEKWKQLLTPLRSGAKGSKIIITTRIEEVASKVQTVPTHYLRVLEDEDCWKLFARHAYLDVNSTANPPELQEIGKKIVRKCGGLPLAAKALGGVLRLQREPEKWKKVLKSEIWEVQKVNILLVLAKSYIHLPSHLKRCFAHCAMFPQDYKFKKEELVALWMSGRLLVQRKGNQSLEEIGNRYFDDLVSRSFFQRSSDFWGNSRFVMHDLVHDLARFVSGEFCSRTRHLSCGRSTLSVLKKFIRETPFLRSFVLADELLRHISADWAFMVTDFVLEILMLPFAQLSSPQKPQYALAVMILSLVVMLSCFAELVYRWKSREVKLGRQGWIACAGFLGAVCQFTFDVIGYSYMSRGKESPIKISLSSIIFLVLFFVSRCYEDPIKRRRHPDTHPC